MTFADRTLGAVIAAGLYARAMIFPSPRRRTTAERLAMLPLAGAPLRDPVHIRWDMHQIPHIDARSDTDLAVGLGVVHAHLRLGQIELMRRLSQARISEMIGPLGVELDRTILLMALGRAVPDIIAGLPAETRAWAEAFVAGLNHVISNTVELPYECRFLGIRPAPMSLAEFFTLARLVSADISWMVGARLLRARAKAGQDWAKIWPRLLAGGAPALMGAAGDASGDLLARHIRGGSNAAAIAGCHTATGAAMIASDPHLGLGLPNNWLIAGMHSPSYAAVGLMLPGMPFVALGRNENIAWGGTSLHAASSELIDVSGLRADEFAERRVTVAVRGAGRRTLRLRETPFGPVVSDGMLLKQSGPLALRWVGHAASDELSAMLGVMRARNFEEFNLALQGFAVPGQTMVCAGVDGRVGKCAAVHMPRRAQDPPADLMVTPAQAWDFADIKHGGAMPVWADPPDGIVASANERPDRGDISLGFFFSPMDRAQRIRALLAAPGARTEADMRALQQDVFHPGALPVRDELLAMLPAEPMEFRAALQSWAGTYDTGSAGALAYELLLGALLRQLFADGGPPGYQAVWGTRLLLLDEMRALPPQTVHGALVAVLPRVVANWRRWRIWGRVHRYRPAHHFGALPGLGWRFRAPPFAAPGGDDTLHKTGHGLVSKPHFVGFGACARHVSDLAHADANRFVLLGGQDGWLGSANFYDQVALWQRGEYLTVPLRLTETTPAFPHETVLQP